MVKKILKWTIYASIVGLLIFGGVIRTQAKAGQQGIQSGSEHELDHISSQEQEGKGTGGWSREGEENTGRIGGGAGRNGESSGTSEDLHLAEEEDHEWVQLSGFVTGLDSESLWIETDEEESLEITGRAWSFVQEGGLTFTVTDELELEGFFEDDEFEVSAIWNLTEDTFLQIREESGRPLWSGGRGR